MFPILIAVSWRFLTQSDSNPNQIIMPRVSWSHMMKSIKPIEIRSLFATFPMTVRTTPPASAQLYISNGKHLQESNFCLEVVHFATKSRKRCLGRWACPWRPQTCCLRHCPPRISEATSWDTGRHRSGMVKIPKSQGLRVGKI